VLTSDRQEVFQVWFKLGSLSRSNIFVEVKTGFELIWFHDNHCTNCPTAIQYIAEQQLLKDGQAVQIILRKTAHPSLSYSSN